MIITLPVSHLIDADALPRLPGVQALEFKEAGPLLTRQLPAIFHSNLGIVQDAFMDWFDEAVSSLRDMNLKLFSFDCGPAARKVRLEDHAYMAASDVLTRDSLISLTAKRIAHIRDRLDCRLAMENLNYFPTDAYKHVCEPEFIAEIVRSNDVGFVLDLAHAVVSAKNLGVSIDAYLDGLPLECVKEIHLSAAGQVNGEWRDLHAEPTDDDFAMLQRVLRSIDTAPYVVIEYYDDFERLVVCYDKLRQVADEGGKKR